MAATPIVDPLVISSISVLRLLATLCCLWLSRFELFYNYTLMSANSMSASNDSPDFKVYTLGYSDLKCFPLVL